MDDPSVNKSIRTLIIFLVWCSKGLYLEIGGPTLIDLKLIFNTSYYAVTRSVSGRGVGGFLGAIIGGVIVDKYENHLDLALGLSTTLASIFLSAIPFVPEIGHVWLLFFATGCLGSVINVVGIRYVLKMWKEKSPSWLAALHMGYGIGALAAPIICTPFLATLSIRPGTNKQGNHDYNVIKESRVEHAYLLIGLFTMCVSIPFYFYQYRRSRFIKLSELDLDHLDNGALLMKKSRTFKEIINPATYIDGNFRFRLSMLIILFIFYFNLVGGQLSMASLIRTFSVDVYQFGKDQASIINTGFWLSLTIGRFISAIISRYISVKRLFPTQVVFHMGAAILLYLYGTSGPTTFTALILLESLSLAPLYPQGIAYGNTQMDITGLSLMVIAFAGSFGDMVYLWSAGFVYDNYGPQSFFVLSVLAAVCMVLCIVLFKTITEKLKNPYPNAVSVFENSKQINAP